MADRYSYRSNTSDQSFHNWLLSWGPTLKINSIKCDYKGCKHLTNMIVRMSDLPNNVIGRVAPSYEVWVKLCGNHGVSILEKAEQLDFVVINNSPWADWAPYSYKCVRCNYVWVSNYLHSKHEEYGKLPITCPHCSNIYWYKEPRMKREATTGTVKPGRTWKNTEVYHQVKEGAPVG